MQYFLHRDQKQTGPFTEDAMKTKLASGEITPSDLVWREGQEGWLPLAQMGFIPLLTDGAPPPPFVVAPKKTSSLTIATIVCAFLGILFAPLQLGTIVMGHMALSEIKKNPNLKGRSMAITSLVIAYIFVFILVACVIIAVSNQIWHWAE